MLIIALVFNGFRFADMLRHFFLILMIGFAALVHQNAFAQTYYVTDEFKLMLRTGPGIGNKIIKTLPTGTKLSVVIQDAGKGHSQVRTEDGTIGYVFTKFVSQEVPAKFRVQSLEKQLAELQGNPEGLQSRLVNLQESYDQLSQNYQKNITVKEDISQQLEKFKSASANAVGLSETNTKLEEEVRQLILQLDDIRIQNETMQDQSEKKWFALGVSTVLLGIFLGWVLSRFKPRNRRSGW